MITSTVSFRSCRASQGGGLYVSDWYSGTGLTVLGGSLLFSGCAATWGGGVLLPNGAIHFEAEVVFINCSAKLAGGGLYSERGAVRHSGSTVLQFVNCTAVERAALLCGGPVTVSRLYVHSCMDQTQTPVSSRGNLSAKQIMLADGGPDQESQAYIGSRNLDVTDIDCTAIHQCWTLGESRKVQTLRCREGTMAKVIIVTVPFMIFRSRHSPSMYRHPAI